MFIALDKLANQGVKQVIIVVPERSYFVEKQREALGRMAERGVVPK